jgi:glycosyltransferase involved in cell wall biosynthesis
MKRGILLPAYNEERNIAKVIRECKKFVPSAKIVVVDDGSSDRTAMIARKEGAKVLRHSRNLGKGEALKTGIKYFRKNDFDAIVILDADGQYSAKDAKKFFSVLKDYDFVIGQRDFSKVPFRHRVGNLVWKTAFNLLFGTNLKDTNCGYIGLSKKAMQTLKNIHGGYIIENSMLAEAVEKGLRIKQIPVNVKYKKVSSLIRGIRMVLGVLVFILIEGLKYRVGKVRRR